MKKLFIGFLCAGIANLQAMEVEHGIHDINDPYSTLPAHFSDPRSRSFQDIARDTAPRTTGKDGTTGTSRTTGKSGPKTDGPRAPQPVAKSLSGEPVARSGVDVGPVAGPKDSGVARDVIDDVGGTIGGGAKPQSKPRTVIESVKSFFRKIFGDYKTQVKEWSIDIQLTDDEVKKKQYVNKIENIFQDMNNKFDADMQAKLKSTGSSSPGCQEVMEFFVNSSEGPMHAARQAIKQKMLLNVNDPNLNPMENYNNLVSMMEKAVEYYDKSVAVYPKVIEELSTVEDAGGRPLESTDPSTRWLKIIPREFYDKFLGTNIKVPDDVTTLFTYIINGNKPETVKKVNEINTSNQKSWPYSASFKGTELMTGLKTVIKTYLDSQIKVLDQQITNLSKAHKQTEAESLFIKKIILTGLKTQVLA